MNERSSGEHAENEVLRLPVWKDVAEKLIAEGLTYGSELRIDDLARRIRLPADSPKVRWAVLNLTRYLREHYSLQSRTRKGILLILQPKEHYAHGKKLGSKAVRYQKREFDCYLETPREGLSADDARRLDAAEEKAALRLVLLKRAGMVGKLIKRERPELLQ